MSPRRALRRLGTALDWRTFAVAGAFLTLMVVAYIVFTSGQAAHDASQQQQAARKAATRRIDLLTAKINGLISQGTLDAANLARLAAANEALAEQIRQLGGTPVLTVTAPPRGRSSTHPRATPTTAPRPSTKPSPTSKPTMRPSQTPSPTPACRLPNAVPVCL